MRYDFEVRRLVALPIEDHSELEELLRAAEEDQCELIATFQSYDCFETEMGSRQKGIYLFGIFRSSKQWAEELMREMQAMMTTAFCAEYPRDRGATERIR